MSRKVSKEELIRMGREDPYDFDEVEGRWVSEAESEGDVEEGPTMKPVDELTAEEKDAAKAYVDAYRIGRADERARIVAWLYRYAEVLRGRHTSADGHGYVEHAASLIEAGISP